jgi:hypothetical protein
MKIIKLWRESLQGILALDFERAVGFAQQKASITNRAADAEEAHHYAGAERLTRETEEKCNEKLQRILNEFLRKATHHKMIW